MTDAFAKRDEIVSEEAFLELSGLTSSHFRRLVREGFIAGVIQLAEGSYIVDMHRFINAASTSRQRTI